MALPKIKAALAALLVVAFLAAGCCCELGLASPEGSSQQVQILSSAGVSVNLAVARAEKGSARRYGSLRVYRLDAIPSVIAIVLPLRSVGPLEIRERLHIRYCRTAKKVQPRAPPQITSIPA